MLTQTEHEFQTLKTWSTKIFDPHKGLPDNPCLLASPRIVFFEFEVATSGPFWPLLASLAELHGDSEVGVIIWNPDPVDFYAKQFGVFGAFKMATTGTEDEFWAVLSEEPANNAAAAVVNQAGTWSAAARSAKWGLWSERSPGLSIAYSVEIEGLDEWIGRSDAESIDRRTAEMMIAEGFVDAGKADEFVRSFRSTFFQK